MPGKTSQASNRGKQESSKDRLNSALTSESGFKKISIWPEWTDAELAAEKWDLGGQNPGGGGGGGGGGGKSRPDKTKTSHLPVVYDDPEGILLPPSLTESGTVVWKRPIDDSITDAMGHSTPVIVDNSNSSLLNLYSSNKELLYSQFICWIIGQLNALWEMRYSLSVDAGGLIEGENEGSLAWRPWEHIYPHIKSSVSPQINLMGKYCVRIYWMGCWRKVTIDDKLPFLKKVSFSRKSSDSAPSRTEENENIEEEVSFVPLYPRTAILTELWPALLTKAILKVTALDYCWNYTGDEFGDSSVIHMLTGWTFKTIQLRSCPATETWDMLSDLLPHWVRKKDEEEEDDRMTEKDVEVTLTESVLTRTRTEEVEKEQQTPSPRQDYIVMGMFDSCFPRNTIKPPAETVVKEVTQSEDLLKRFKVIPSDYDLTSMPSYPVLLTQVRDEPLVLPPKVPPLPSLQAPYYLGLTKRRRHPGLPTPPPTPPPVDPRFVELLPVVPPRHIADAVSVTSTATTKSLASEATGTNSGNKSEVGSKLATSVGEASGTLESEKRKVFNGTKPTWMDYIEFLSAFKSLLVFKNHCSYKHRDTYTNLSKIAGESPVAPKKGVSISHLSSPSISSSPKEQQYLFTDNVDAISISFIFSCLSNWREGGKDTHRFEQLPSSTNITVCVEEEPSHYLTPAHPTSSNNRLLTPDSASFDQQLPPSGDVSCGTTKSETSLFEGECHRKRKSIQSGSLVVERYSWRTVQFGEVVLRISTTGTRGGVLTLPPGRQVFKLHVSVPIGHHLEIFSDSYFVLANKDSIFTYLLEDSKRFLSISSSIADTILSSSEHCRDQVLLEESLKPLATLLTECKITSGCVKFLLAGALYSWSTHAEECGLDLNSKIAWKAFLYNVFGILEEKLPLGISSTSVNGDIPSLRNYLRMYYSTKDNKHLPTVPEELINREYTLNEDRASRKITHRLRRYTEARLKNRMVSGSHENETTSKHLAESLSQVKSNLQKLGSTLLHGAIKLSPSLEDGFPFSEDQAYSIQYSGLFPPIQANSWTIALRKTMRVTEPQLVAFSFSCPLQSTLLRVIDNDTMEEMPQVFQVTIPRVYQPNEQGYTLQVEAWTTGAPPPDEGDSKKWKLRVVTSNRDLPPLLEGCSTDEKKMTEEVFHKQEMLTYCLPDREDIVLRYCLTTNSECQVSIHLTASKQDALIKLEVLDHEKSLVSTEGRGTCIIPLWILQSSALVQAVEDTVGDPAQENIMPVHKYIVQARVLRKSWPIAETAWPSIATIFHPEERTIVKPGSARKVKGKDKKKSNNNNLPSHSSPVNVPPPQIDTDKPHLLLRIISNGSEDTPEVKKDTEKEDLLKSMVQAWETQEPGRSKKAIKSRQKFLDTRAIREGTQGPAGGGGDNGGGGNSTSETGIPQPNIGPVKINQMDLTPFIIKEADEIKLLNETELSQRLAERQQLFKDYRNQRQAILQLRNEDRERRNEAKEKQLDIAEQWQVDLDVSRNKLNAFRDVIRERSLAKERTEIEVLKVQEEISSTGRDSKKGKGGRKKK